MKVTVYFNNVRVIVPCGKGDILVRDLVELAVTRYKKATGKPSSSVVRIRNLKSSRDDGILYPDDKLSDVADDREQIIADFEEDYSSLPHYHCGDGTSTSSVCTGSPDLFSVEVSSHGSVPYAHSDVEITEESSPSGITPLQVRRGSEPALNNLCPSSPTTDPSKRWSTAVVINPGSPEKQKNPPEESKPLSRDSMVVNGDSKPPSRNFSRGSGRLSILGNNPETYRWVEAADRHLMNELNDKLSVKPLVDSCSTERDAASDSSSASEERERTIILKNEPGPLGLHIFPDYDSKGRDTGLVIQGIEAGGRIDRDGRFCVGDRIVEINGKSLRNISFQEAHDVFKNALRTPQIKLELIRGGSVNNSKTAAIPRKPPPPVYPKPAITEEPRKTEEESTLVEGEERVGGVITKVATVTPTKKVPAVLTHRLATANTRKIGKKLSIKLTKGESGLGFSITTRDNPAGGNSPIYIKNVLPKGAAIEDGRLQPGDRLLEVNGIEMTGKSQAEAVKILRNTPLGGIVDLIVSRQEVDTTQSDPETVTQTLLKPEEEAVIFPWKHREILTFQIPLNDTGSAGLGVSVKGKSTTNASGPVDLGIFIKSIIPEGAASKDGRLQPNDQLVNINGISLLSISNSNAMETLRKAMTQMDGPIPNAIILTIARRISQPSEEELDSSQASRSSSSKPSENDMPSYSDDKNSEQHEPANDIPKTSEANHSVHPVSNSKHQLKDLTNSQKIDAHPPGCNPVIERLTGQSANGPYKKLPNEAYIFTNHNNMQQKLMTLNDEKNRTPYSPTLNVPSCESVLIEDEYSPITNKLKPSGSSENVLQQNKQNNISETTNVASSQLSLDEPPGFERDGFGRQSMSEKRHAQLDAKNTDTYQRNKKAREERERYRQAFEQEFSLEKQPMEPSQSTSASQMSCLPLPGTSNDDEPCGPSLGLRKSSSLESLQTMIQELNKDDEAMKKALQSANTRSSRSRGCNESFRAAVDRSYEAPTPVTMETLDEESESGSSVGHILGRMSDIGESLHPGLTRDPLSDDILNMYCRSSKSSKKKGLLKGLGSVFKFGKNRKSEVKGKFGEEIPPNADQIPSVLVPVPPNKDVDKTSEGDHRVSDIQKKPLPSIPRDNASTSSLEQVQNRQERMQNLREQHQRLHQKRHGHYPLDHKEELYESEIKEKESKLVSSGAISHLRSHSHDEVEDRVKGRSAFNEANRYSHYMNYKEIQQHMNQYYHHEQAPKFRKQNFAAQKSPQERPTSNYFEYESIQQLHRYAISNQVNDMDSSSLPRGSHSVEHNIPHVHAQTNKPFYGGHEPNSGYDRRNMHHHYYCNSALYSHVVPGSKV